jgi:hypothetical protein
MVTSRLITVNAIILATCSVVGIIADVAIEVNCKNTTTSLHPYRKGNVTVFNSLAAAEEYVYNLPSPTPNVTVTMTSDCYVDAPLQIRRGGYSSGVGHGDTTVTWQAAKGARVLGGQPLDRSKWTEAHPLPKWASKPQPNTTLLQYNLSDVNFGDAGVGNFHNGGLGQCGQTRSELFVGDLPMTIARHPNAPLYPGEPWMDWYHVDLVGPLTFEGKPVLRPDGSEITIEDLRDPSSPFASWPLRSSEYHRITGNAHKPTRSLDENSAATVFTASDISQDAVERWIATTSAAQLQDVWLHGFWAFDWADNYIRLTNMSWNATYNETLLQYDPATIPLYQIVSGARFYVVNLPALLDAVGEYYIDQEAGFAYMLADDRFDPRKVESAFSATMGSLVSVASGLRNINFMDIEFSFVRQSALEVTSVTNSLISGITANTLGHTAVIATGQNITVSHVLSIGAGCTAVSVNGGDTSTLATSYNVVSNSVLLRYARWTRTYNPGVAFSGVGINVLGNTIARAPHNGLLGSGNNHHFENNHLHNLCFEARDSGAFYIGRSWVDRGMVLKANLFENITMVEPTALGSDSIQAMYFDDEQSGVTAIDNICQRVHACFLVGGGRDNTIVGTKCRNITGAHCIRFDNRGMNWQAAACTNSSSGPGLLVAQLEAVHYQQPPYSTAYPRIVNTMQDHPCVPVGNLFSSNSCCDCVDEHVISQSNSTIASWYSTEIGSTTAATCSPLPWQERILPSAQ